MKSNTIDRKKIQEELESIWAEIKPYVKDESNISSFSKITQPFSAIESLKELLDFEKKLFRFCMYRTCFIPDMPKDTVEKIEIKLATLRPCIEENLKLLKTKHPERQQLLQSPISIVLNLNYFKPPTPPKSEVKPFELEYNYKKK